MEVACVCNSGRFFGLCCDAPPKEKIRLGLDLSGGTSFTLAIDEARLRSGLNAGIIGTLLVALFVVGYYGYCGLVANIALLTGVILFVLGTGPIRGYAIALSSGILLSLLTALVLPRLVFNATVSPERTKPFHMLKFLKNAHFDFVRWGNVASYTSFACTFVMMATFLFRAFIQPAHVMSARSVNSWGRSWATPPFSMSHRRTERAICF